MNYRITANADGTTWDSGSWYSGNVSPEYHPYFTIYNDDSTDLIFDTLSLYYASPNDNNSGVNNFDGSALTITYTLSSDSTVQASISTPGSTKYGYGYPKDKYFVNADPSTYNYTTNGADTYDSSGVLIPATFNRPITIVAGGSVRINSDWSAGENAGVQFFPLTYANISVAHTVWSYHKDEGWKKDKDIYIYNSDSGMWVKQTKFHLYSEGVWTDKS